MQLNAPGAPGAPGARAAAPRRAAPRLPTAVRTAAARRAPGRRAAPALPPGRRGPGPASAASGDGPAPQPQPPRGGGGAAPRSGDSAYAGSDYDSDDDGSGPDAPYAGYSPNVFEALPPPPNVGRKRQVAGLVAGAILEFTLTGGCRVGLGSVSTRGWDWRGAHGPGSRSPHAQHQPRTQPKRRRRAVGAAARGVHCDRDHPQPPPAAAARGRGRGARRGARAAGAAAPHARHARRERAVVGAGRGARPRRAGTQQQPRAGRRRRPSMGTAAAWAAHAPRVAAHCHAARPPAAAQACAHGARPVEALRGALPAEAVPGAVAGAPGAAPQAGRRRRMGPQPGTQCHHGGTPRASATLTPSRRNPPARPPACPPSTRPPGNRRQPGAARLDAQHHRRVTWRRRRAADRLPGVRRPVHGRADRGGLQDGESAGLWGCRACRAGGVPAGQADSGPRLGRGSLRACADCARAPPHTCPTPNPPGVQQRHAARHRARRDAARGVHRHRLGHPYDG
jgi:hypothetical protein